MRGPLEDRLQRMQAQSPLGSVYALALYPRRGFRNGPALGDCLPGACNQLLHLPL